VLERGFLMVTAWWNRGELWFVDGRFSDWKNTPRIQDLFLGVPVLGMMALSKGREP
jgi:hypothetical protein